MSEYDFAVYIFSDESALSGDEKLYHSASLYTGMGKDTFKKETSEGGKPFFAGLSQVHFSITHSGAYWACAFGSRPVGLDLQQHRDCRIKDISERFFNPEEKAFLESRGYAPKDFFDLWAAKESYVKYTGEGIPHGLDSFSVLNNNLGVSFRHLSFPGNYSLCLCSEKVGNVTLYPVK